MIAGISYVVFPAYARIAHDPARFKPAFLRSSRWATLVSAPLGLILGSVGEPLAIIAFGERWRSAGEVTAAICLLIPVKRSRAIIGEGFKGAGIPAKRDQVIAIRSRQVRSRCSSSRPPAGLFGVGIGISVDAIVGASVAIALASSTLEIPSIAPRCDRPELVVAATIMAAVRPG